MRIYKHLNPDKINAYPTSSTRARISSCTDLISWITNNNLSTKEDKLVTLTFIVDTEGWLWIADRHSEHFACAAGKEVLSAGEISFQLYRVTITVLEVTNQSLGYCPEPDSWPAVATALARAGIDYPDRFTTEFVFRKCSACGQRSIIKDGWYGCEICGSLLSSTWNFID